MSKHDFTKEEFADRLQRTRAAIAAGRPRLAARDPSGVDALADRTGQQELHGVPMSRRCRPSPASSSIFTRDMERNEFELDTMADEVRSYNGREPEDPMEAFAKFADELGPEDRRASAWRCRPGISTRTTTLQLKDILGDGAGRRAIEPDQQPEAREIAAGARVSPPIRGHRRRMRWKALLARSPGGRSELELSAAAYQRSCQSGSVLPASTMNLMTGERSCFASARPTERQA